MKIEKRDSWDLEHHGVSHLYEIGGWTMEVIIRPDGTVNMQEGDANPEHARQAAKVWQAWAEFARRKNKEGWL